MSELNRLEAERLEARRALTQHTTDELEDPTTQADRDREEERSCPACSGSMFELTQIHFLSEDVLAVCSTCRGVQLRLESKKATSWCRCKTTNRFWNSDPAFDQTEIYYWRAEGAHGWIHATCGQVTQTG